MAQKRVRPLVTAFALSTLLASPAVSFADDAAALYKSKCAMCHGADGKGETPAGKSLKLKDLASDDVQKATDAEIAEVITNGKGKMKAVKGVTADQVKDLVAYVRAFNKK
jgi:cytochrome c6